MGMAPRQLLFLFLALSVSFAAPLPCAHAEGEPVKDEAATPAPEPAPKPTLKPALNPAKKKAAKKKKPYDYDRSRYKSREPSQTPNYKFNEKGEPIRTEKKKNLSLKKKKRSEPPEAELKEGSEACSAQDSCAAKKTEADAL